MLARLLVTCMLLVALLTGCTSYLPPGSVPISPLSEQNVKVVTIPLPAISANPNEGITYGALAAFLLHNDKDEVCTLLAPQVNYNDLYGTTGTVYGAYYPSRDRSYEWNISQSAKINFDYELRLRDQTLMDKKLELNAFLYTFADGSARFYGFQDSKKQMETNYADQETGFTVTAGYPLPFDHTQVVFGERLRIVDIDPGAVTSVPYILPRFANVPGVHGFVAHAQSLGVVYNTLDSNTMPTTGIRLKVSIDNNAQALGGSADYRHYDTEVKGYLPLMDARFISVARFEYSQTLGEDVPFLERSSLGGENTLRGYGRNRFIDSSFLLLNLEERIRLFRWELFGVTADWEMAPFIDLGSVMTSLVEANSRAFQFNPGLGLRAVIRPNIVGRIDVGVGKEGPAVFVGLGYPF
ncbi:BamA/TamA family outer membrane protein [Geomonas sp.]|uniref:BamA/TamA family outer membrane protein n=1 Tax=Geomonas sp. TaxID=2651584 RepID=UPI002B4A8CEF|nr:BamA/TamA family outer membrane protein [Geomonas sp.]HJV33644.1 BamA/TamA family outer membrane protein [Geomonas sp.]